MICHFRRHLPKEDTEAWLAEVPVDGGALLRFSILLFCKPFCGRFPVPQSIPFPHWQRFPRFAAVAAGPSRRNPPGRHLWYGFLIRFLSTLAAYPAIRCRCGKRSYLIVPNCRDGGQAYQAQCISTHFIGIYCHFALSSMQLEILCLLTKLIL